MNKLISYDENIINIKKKMIPYDKDIIQSNKIVLYDKNIENYDSKALIPYEKLNRSVLRLTKDRMIEDQPTRSV